MEDNQDDSDYLRSRLKRKGWDCEIASSGEVAQGLVKHQYYPICFVDMRLPGMSGQALVRLLSRDTPRTSVVIVCGEAADVVGVPEGIFVGLIKKPATLEAIEDMLVKLNV